MWNGAPIVTAATGLTTTLISPTAGQDACAIPHIEQHQSPKDEERPGMNSGREMRNKEIPGPVQLTRHSVLVFSDI